MNIGLRSPHDRDIVRLALPAFGALVAQPVYVLTDTAIVGRIGTAELAGLSLASAVLLTLTAMLIFLAYGTTGVVGRHLGAGDERGAAHHGVQAIWLSLGVGVFFSGVLLTAGPSLVEAFGAESAATEAAKTYLLISALGVPAILATLAGTGYLRGLQDTRTPLVVALATALVNLVLEIVLVYPLDLGVAGSAWSTVVAEYLGAAVYLRAIFAKARRLDVSIRPDGRALATMAHGGVHLFIRTIALRGAFLISTIVASTMGTVQLAAHEIGIQIWSLLALALDSVAIAGQALVARYLGAANTKAAREASQRMIVLSICLGVLFLVVLLSLSGPISAIFSEDDAVTDLAAFVLVWVAITQPIGGHVFAIDGILIGAGDLKYLGRAMWVATTIFGTCAAVVVYADLGIGWLWASLLVLMVTRAVTLQARFSTDAWQITGT